MRIPASTLVQPSRTPRFQGAPLLGGLVPPNPPEPTPGTPRKKWTPAAIAGTGLLAALLSAPFIIGFPKPGQVQSRENLPEVKRSHELHRSLNVVGLTKRVAAQEEILTEILNLKPNEAKIPDHDNPNILVDETFDLKRRAVHEIGAVRDEKAQDRLIHLVLRNPDLYDDLAEMAHDNADHLSDAIKELVFVSVHHAK